jgi:hypothetical protein
VHLKAQSRVADAVEMLKSSDGNKDNEIEQARQSEIKRWKEVAESKTK